MKAIQPDALLSEARSIQPLELIASARTQVQAAEETPEGGTEDPARSCYEI